MLSSLMASFRTKTVSRKREPEIPSMEQMEDYSSPLGGIEDQIKFEFAFLDTVSGGIPTVRLSGNTLEANGQQYTVKGRLWIDNTTKQTLMASRLSVVLLSGNGFRDTAVIKAPEAPSACAALFSRPIYNHVCTIFKHATQITPGRHSVAFSMPWPASLPPSIDVDASMTAKVVVHSLHCALRLTDDKRATFSTRLNVLRTITKTVENTVESVRVNSANDVFVCDAATRKFFWIDREEHPECISVDLSTTDSHGTIRMVRADAWIMETIKALDMTRISEQNGFVDIISEPFLLELPPYVYDEPLEPNTVLSLMVPIVGAKAQPSGKYGAITVSHELMMGICYQRDDESEEHTVISIPLNMQICGSNAPSVGSARDSLQSERLSEVPDIPIAADDPSSLLSDAIKPVDSKTSNSDRQSRTNGIGLARKYSGNLHASNSLRSLGNVSGYNETLVSEQIEASHAVSNGTSPQSVNKTFSGAEEAEIDGVTVYRSSNDDFLTPAASPLSEQVAQCNTSTSPSTHKNSSMSTLQNNPQRLSVPTRRTFGLVFCASHAFEPSMPDELEIHQDDMINIKHILEPGWCFGHNIRTETVGVMPTAVFGEKEAEIVAALSKARRPGSVVSAITTSDPPKQASKEASTPAVQKSKSDSWNPDFNSLLSSLTEHMESEFKLSPLEF